MPKQITLTANCLIRHKYKGEWEYAHWHQDHSFTVICRQSDLEEWRSGTQILPLLYCDDAELQRQSKRTKEMLRDRKTVVIQCVLKQNKWEPRRIVIP